MCGIRLTTLVEYNLGTHPQHCQIGLTQELPHMLLRPNQPALMFLALTATVLGQQISVNVPGSSNPYLAGMPDGSTASNGDTAPDQSPVQVPSIVFSNTLSLTFTATGMVSFSNPLFSESAPDGLDGFASFPSHATGSENGISDITTRFNSLLGVFLDDGNPSLSPAPASLNFHSTGNVAGGPDYLTLAPLLKQVFFIGDGLTSTGTIQEIVPPPGASRMFLGTMDGQQWSNNSGSFDVVVTAVVPEPCYANIVLIVTVATLLRKLRPPLLA